MKKKIQLNLGCGIIVKSGFINIDKCYKEKELRERKKFFINAIFEKDAHYIQGDMLDLPFENNYADYIETVDAIEHISFRFILKAIMEMYRVLKKGGKLVIITPNFNQLAELWTQTITNLSLDNQESFEKYKNLMEVIYGNQTYEGEFHATAFNPQFLNLLLIQAGFNPKKIKIIIYPMGNSDIKKKIKTQTWDKNATCRTEMLLAEVIK